MTTTRAVGSTVSPALILSAVISSPLIRAKQTAEIALENFAKEAKFAIEDALRSEAEVTDTMAMLVKYKNYERIMIVGHDPHMSQFASSLLGSPTPVVEMKKSALAKFEIVRIDPIRMRGILVALLPPKVGGL